VALLIGLSFHLPDWFRKTLGYNLMALIGVLLVLGAREMRAPHWTIQAPISFFSKISYSTYLWHMQFLWIGRWLFPGQRGYLVFLAGSLVAIFGPAALYYSTEVPFLWFRDRL